MNIQDILTQRILILDGAMGTNIQRYGLSEKDYRGNRFEHITTPLKGNNDLLCITRPDVIAEIHEAYLEAGADIIETNTFNATSVSMSEYGMQEFVEEINKSAAQLALACAARYSTPEKPRFVAGSIGPTNKTCSISPDVNNPAFRAISFDTLEQSYIQQIVALLQTGVDLLLIETIFDTLNAKAALAAANKAMEKTGRIVPIMLSVTLADSGGRTLSGQTLEAFWVSVQHAPILSIGLNCSFGARDMKPHLARLASMASCFVSAYPNAGLPNELGDYDETPDTMALQVKEYIDEQLVNIIGGCCGTTPAHIAKYQALIANAPLRTPIKKENRLQLSGLEAIEIVPEMNFVNIGERCNVAGSRKFLRLINEKKYDEALQIARVQIEDGAQIVDINMDDAMLDTPVEMEHFLNLIASEPDIAKVPIMIDSSRWEVIKRALKVVQGKSIVNSISLKEGEALFMEHARYIKDYGAAVVVMAFDEEGQADSFERKISICERAYRLLVDIVGFSAHDIIFDPNILSIATGIEEHNNYAVDFIRATKWIKTNLPYAKVSGGVSNLSFSLRGNNYLREAMHSVFLYHAIAAGMDMGIVNPATSISYADIPKQIREQIEDAVLNRSSNATEQLIALAEELSNTTASVHSKRDPREGMNASERVQYALIKGISDTLKTDIEETLAQQKSALAVIDKVLMTAMNTVGQRFGAGEMFLPQVVKSARTMKQAVAILQPYIELEKNKGEATTAGKYLLATVKGDVHDIGKNIVSVILSCNNFEVIDLGVMVPTHEIVRQALEHNVDFIGLSGLITPSLEEMCQVAKALQESGASVPLMIGGATTSPLHTAAKIAPLYNAPVIHLKDAAQNPLVATRLMNPQERESFISELNTTQEVLRKSLEKQAPTFTPEQAYALRPHIEWNNYTPTPPASSGRAVITDYNIEQLLPLINWKFFLRTWQLDAKFASIAQLHGCDSCRATWLTQFDETDRPKASQAMQLHKEAMRMLNTLALDPSCIVRTKFIAHQATPAPQSITLDGTTINTPRQCTIKPDIDATYVSLSDFVAPQGDYVGVFATTIANGLQEQIAHYQTKEDSYNALLLQSLCDRLVEAATELLHYDVRTQYWGYAPNEVFDPHALVTQKYIGIRPAIGYPSLPDQQQIFNLDKVLHLDQIGITLTSHGAMHPASSTCGIMIAYPDAHYFVI